MCAVKMVDCISTVNIHDSVYYGSPEKTDPAQSKGKMNWRQKGGGRGWSLPKCIFGNNARQLRVFLQKSFIFGYFQKIKKMSDQMRILAFCHNLEWSKKYQIKCVFWWFWCIFEVGRVGRGAFREVSNVKKPSDLPPQNATSKASFEVGRVGRNSRNLPTYPPASCEVGRVGRKSRSESSESIAGGFLRMSRNLPTYPPKMPCQRQVSRSEE